MKQKTFILFAAVGCDRSLPESPPGGSGSYGKLM